MSELLDSGSRREFESGAVRDISEGKGRCDLLPLDVLSLYFTINDKPNPVLNYIHHYIYEGDIHNLMHALSSFDYLHWNDALTMMLEASHQYEDGAKKYNERNWEKGIPVHCYIDSGVRHYLKFVRRDDDEPHDRAFVWNMLCAIRTHTTNMGLVDLSFNLTEIKEKGEIKNEQINNHK